MSAVPSLLDPPVSSPFSAAADWVAGTLFGSVAVSLCVIAIAFVGLRMMTGHLAARDGLRVAAACFVLLGAPAIALGLKGAADVVAPSGAAEPVQVQAFPDPRPLPPANYNPYAGASMRRD
jgi:type IV secretory pathway VirB2 component (pilin)